MKKITIAICDDVEYLCDGFRAQVQYEEDMCFAGAAYDSAGCIALVRETRPDILLLDIQMETETSGIDIIPALKEIAPALKIIMLTSFNDENYIFSAFVGGVDDYIIKSLSHEEIMDKIRNVYNNTSTLRPEIAQKLAKKSKEIAEGQKSLLYAVDIMVKLSTSEFEVLRAIYSGESYKQIAQKRFVEECTIRTLASRILKKFKVTNMKHLIQNLKELEVFQLFDK